MLKIGIYGGTFSPPHLGHSNAARCVLAHLSLDKLLFVPTALPPHKDLPSGSPTPEQRAAMTRIAADQVGCPDRVEVCELELHRPGPSYTADTLRALRETYPDAALYLLMGSDMFLTLQDWHTPEAIMAQAEICAFARTQADRDKLEEQADYLRNRFQAKITLLTLDPCVEVSSTQVRNSLASGGGRDGLSPAVYGYILLHGLYGTHADLKHLDVETLRCCSYSMVLSKRIPHIRGTEEEAVRLARHWGEDEVDARRAGILHDCTKYLTLEEQLDLCRTYHVALDDLEQQAVKLLHAKTGACIAKYVFGENDAVYQAIFWHTTGKAGMTRLEKILYLADYIEPNRDFPGVDALRALAYQDLDAAMLQGLEMSVRDLTQRGVPIHRHTMEGRNWFLQQKGTRQ